MKKVNEDQIRIQFHEAYDQTLEYVDKLPDEMTEEDLKEKYGKVVWCEFTDCFWNTREVNLQRTWGTINGDRNFSPINPSEMVWNGICSRPNEIVLRFKSIKTTTGKGVKVPYCYTAASNGKTGHMDFAAMLQGDGTPFGGNIDSQNTSLDGMYHSPFAPESMGRERIVKHGSVPERPHKSHTIGE